jgi:hypothetical protein
MITFVEEEQRELHLLLVQNAPSMRLPDQRRRFRAHISRQIIVKGHGRLLYSEI